jgi:hypothetical protein
MAFAPVGWRKPMRHAMNAPRRSGLFGSLSFEPGPKKPIPDRGRRCFDRNMLLHVRKPSESRSGE